MLRARWAGSLWRPRRWSSWRDGCRPERGRTLAICQQHRDRRVNLDLFSTFGHEDPGQRTLVYSLHFHRRLVGLDLSDDVASLDLLTFLDEPLGELALSHGRGQGRHQ